MSFIGGLKNKMAKIKQNISRHGSQEIVLLRLYSNIS
jgi:hypothetical protein